MPEFPSTFVRAKHDKQNPYVMISREMLQDPSISPKAKGILCYLLSLPNDWKISHTQLIHALACGRDYLNSGIDELIQAGYCDREQVKEKGQFRGYNYVIYEFKKSLPNRESRCGLSESANPHLHNKEAIHTKETTTKEAAVVSFGKELILELKEKGLSESEIESLAKFNPERVKFALNFASAVKIKTTLIQTITWHCQQLIPPEIAKKAIDPHEIIVNNFKHGEFYNSAECFVNPDGIAFCRGTHHEQIKFKEPGWLERFLKMLKNFSIHVPTELAY